MVAPKLCGEGLWMQDNRLKNEWCAFARLYLDLNPPLLLFIVPLRSGNAALKDKSAVSVDLACSEHPDDTLSGRRVRTALKISIRFSSDEDRNLTIRK